MCSIIPGLSVPWILEVGMVAGSGLSMSPLHSVLLSFLELTKVFSLLQLSPSFFLLTFFLYSKKVVSVDSCFYSRCSSVITCKYISKYINTLIKPQNSETWRDK